jgi:hypothetical protein
MLSGAILRRCCFVFRREAHETVGGPPVLSWQALLLLALAVFGTLAVSGVTSAAVAPNVSASPTALYFSPTVVGSSSLLSLTVTTTSTYTFGSPSYSITGSNFSVVTDGCKNTTISPDSPCVITVMFMPTIIGAAPTSSLALVSRFQVAAQAPTVRLFGSGTAELRPPVFVTLQATPSSITVGSREKSSVTARIVVNGRPDVGVGIHFSDPGVCGSIDPLSTVTNAAGYARTTYHAASSAGSCVIVAAAVIDGVGSSHSLTVVTKSAANSSAFEAPALAILGLVVLTTVLLAWKLLPGWRLKATWQAAAEGRGPDHPCHPGSWHCQRPDIDVQIERRHVASAALVSFHPRVVHTQSLEVVRRLNAAYVDLRDGRESESMEVLLSLATTMLSRLWSESSGPTLVISALLHISGPEVSATFVLTRCSRSGRPGRLKWQWEAKVSDEKDYETPIKVLHSNHAEMEAAREWLAAFYAKALSLAANEHHIEGSGVLSVTLS